MNNNTEYKNSKHELIPVGRAKDITGMKFNRLIAIGRTHNKNGRATWLCECECGNCTTVIAKHLVSGTIKSCGCLLKELQTPIDLSGKQFGRWKVLELSNKKSKHGDIYWNCKCECGTTREVLSRSLRSGDTVSCGCYRDKIRNDITGKRFGKLVAIKPTDKSSGTNVIWELKCDCGNTTHVHTGNLGEHHRKTRSCGCLHMEVVGVNLTGNRYGRLTVIKQGEHIGNKIGWLCKCDCGEVTTVSGTHLTSGATQSCGCIRNEIAGINHPNYNPNKTDEERLKKRYILGKHTLDGFRNKVYKRDNYTCQVCNQVGGKLNAHHLDGWNWAVDKRFDTDNGVTLCESCHNEFHNIYGKGNNTREQFEEYCSTLKSNRITHKERTLV